MTTITSDETLVDEAPSWRSFVLAFVVTSFVCLAACALLIAGTRTLGRHPMAYQTLYSYQMQKMAAGAAETVFLGDSSLGNAIDAERWQELSGSTTLNLALTGAYGYAGTKQMLLSLLEHGRPKNLVVMQTAEMPTRPQPPDDLIEGMSSTWNGWRSFTSWWHLNMNLQELQSSWDFVRRRGADLLSPVGSPNDERIANDYILQGQPRPVSPDTPPLNGDDIQAAQIEDLQEIGAICRTENLRCFYAFGPLADTICDASSQYFALVERAAVDAGFTMLGPRPLCLAPQEVGDSPDHVAPQFKREFTDGYFDLWRGRQAGASSS